MTFRTLFTRLIFLGFMAGVGYSLAKSIRYQSFLGILLALLSMGAGIYILYLINKAGQAEESGTEEIA